MIKKKINGELLSHYFDFIISIFVFYKQYFSSLLHSLYLNDFEKGSFQDNTPASYSSTYLQNKYDVYILPCNDQKNYNLIYPFYVFKTILFDCLFNV